MTPGEKIRELRAKKGIKVRALAKDIGISHTQIVHLENDFDTHTGKAPRLSLETFIKICEYFEYDLMTFLEETGYIEKKSPTVALVEDERETYIIDIFRALPPNLQKIMIAQAEGIVDNYGIKVEYRKAQGVS